MTRMLRVPRKSARGVQIPVRRCYRVFWQVEGQAACNIPANKKIS